MEKAAGRTLPITAFGAEHDPAAWRAYRDAGIERIVLSIEFRQGRHRPAKARPVGR